MKLACSPVTTGWFLDCPTTAPSEWPASHDVLAISSSKVAEETGVGSNIRGEFCTRLRIEIWLALPCPNVDLSTEGLRPPRVVTSTSLKLDLGTSVVDVEKSERFIIVGSLERGSAIGPPKTRLGGSGLSSRIGAILSVKFDRECRRRK